MNEWERLLGRPLRPERPLPKNPGSLREGPDPPSVILLLSRDPVRQEVLPCLVSCKVLTM
jgi:hypothetical protein